MVAADSEYTSYGRFAPVYDHAIDRLYDCLPVIQARQAEKVLRAYAEHASNIGTCYPGIDRIKERTHYSETIIKRCWIWLGQLDFIRVHREYSAARRTTRDTYQLSPFVLFIKPEHIQEAEMLWKSTSLHLNEIIHGQPIPESRISNQNQNQNDSTNAINHHHHQKNQGMETPAPGKNQHEVPPQPQNRRTAPKTKTQGETGADQNQRAAPDQNPTPGAAAPPPRRDYTPFSHPLPDARHEQLAQLVRMGGTHLHVARAMIADYGYDTVLTTWQYVEEQVYANRCHNPVGLLVAKLKSGAVQPGEKIGVAAWLDTQTDRNGNQEG